MKTESISLHVNGLEYDFSVGDKLGQIPCGETLSETLRTRLALTGTKAACGEGSCGCCTVIMDGRAVLSCMLLTVEADGKDITTIEGLADPRTGVLDPVQQAFIDHYAFQCGFCTPGIIMSARALLDKEAAPTPDQVKDALSGNFCRCISQYHVLEAMDAFTRKSEEQ
ncbi:(2Fe-2S)-binding protein [Klebsiella sp. 2680]|uniref:(2Fe-2S)-binding protein n=1 Tax=Klebsiella sp. 2680 TaxID=2018037 RepID=UPI001156DC23|nr:(2Fe-2S)-binding protein [Klebsiella sp. 2680]